MKDYQQSRDDFRKSKVWQNFRKRKFAESSMDYITHKKLKASYHLHHIDLNHEHYEDLSNPDNFVNLNSKTHNIVHELYTFYKKDPGVIDRLKEILEKMHEVNEGKK